jgi:hypothetical protein
MALVFALIYCTHGGLCTVVKQFDYISQCKHEMTFYKNDKSGTVYCAKKSIPVWEPAE